MRIAPNFLHAFFPTKLRLLLILTPCTLYISTMHGQNLVPNGGFEEVINCPYFYDGLHLDCANWFKSIIFPGVPLYESPSPDWFHECGAGALAPPNVVLGFQFPHQGEGYAGLIVYGAANDSSREIMGVQLVEPLEIGSEYDVSFYLTRGYTANNYAVQLASNNLGIKFTNNAHYSTSGSLVDNSADAKIDSIVLDTLNWLPINFTFIPDSTYEYLHIGNFYSDSLTEHTTSEYPSIAYYFIDDVSVTLNSSLTTQEENLQSRILLYPNPAINQISISVPAIELSDFRLQVLDCNGKLVSDNIYSNKNEIQIDVSHLRRSWYIFRVITNDRIYYEKAIILPAH